MRIRRIFKILQPYLTAIAVISVAGLLVFAIYFTELGAQWITFLTGILIASIISMVSRTTRAEWIIARRSAQLKLIKDKLDKETQKRMNYVGEHEKSLSLLKQTEWAYGRLIPRQLLSLLDRKSILDVKLGDQIERKLTVMFTDIRNFTLLSESMPPQENFNFLNSYLKQMEPIIGTHRGIIDKYAGDTILALFTQGADDALSGAIHMLEKMEDYNTGRARAGYTPIQIGIGLNTGLVMIGTIGGENRMESTVIGDTVNLCSRIEEATKTYQTPLLISQNTLYDLTTPGKYDIRFLDRIRVKGKTQPLSIYEVFDNDPIKLRDGKRASKEMFESAIAYYHLKEIPRAMELLKQCIEMTPKDVPAFIYLARCEQYLTTGHHLSTGELNNHLEWKSTYQINIDTIDRSHRWLFEKANEFISASMAMDNQAIRILFANIASHIKESGIEEADILSQYNYPFLKSHMQEHMRFMENFMALKDEADTGNYNLPLLSFRTQLLLCDWFSGHIAKTDRHAGRFINIARFGQTMPNINMPL
jgi:adenylate cyclase